MRKNEYNNRKQLTSLEYAGLEYVFQRIISAYEEAYFGIPHNDQTPVSEITRRTDHGIEVFDGAYDLYMIEGFAVKEIYMMEDRCVIAGFKGSPSDTARHVTEDWEQLAKFNDFLDESYRNTEECWDRDSDILIDVTEFLDESYIDLDHLIGKIQEAQ